MHKTPSFFKPGKAFKENNTTLVEGQRGSEDHSYLVVPLSEEGSSTDREIGAFETDHSL